MVTSINFVVLTAVGHAQLVMGQFWCGSLGSWVTSSGPLPALRRCRKRLQRLPKNNSLSNVFIWINLTWNAEMVGHPF